MRAIYKIINTRFLNMNINKYLKDGYILSPYYSKDDIRAYDKVYVKDLTENDIKEMLVSTSEERMGLLKRDDELVLIKYTARYHVKPEDLLEKLSREVSCETEPDYDDIVGWSHFGALQDDKGFVFLPHLDEEYFKNNTDGIDDYLFEKDDHLVAYIVFLIRMELRKDKVVENLTSYINFINDILVNRGKKERNYKLETYELMFRSIAYEESQNRVLSRNCAVFYHENVLKCAEKGSPYSMKLLGYFYYEGINDFPYDQTKALYWFEKYFKKTGDPDVARTMGYIYYYGRTTNGVPQGDKAFQYFAIGHIAGKYFEATYKLADCYLKGYGTPICPQAAFNLVDEIYKPTRDNFLFGEDSKFADVALRMGTFYKDGIYVEKNLNEAQVFYLEAKAAIKERLKNMEYIGDRSVAAAINRNLEEVENKLHIPSERVVVDGGYDITGTTIGFRKQKYDINFENGKLFVTIRKTKKDDQKYYLPYANSIGFIERSKKVVLQMTLEFPDSGFRLMEAVQENKIVEFVVLPEGIYAGIKMKDNDVLPFFSKTESIVLIPQTIKDIEKRYPVVSVEFYPGSKLYDYLSLDEDVQIDDEVVVNSRGEEKTAIVKGIKYLYEDQLPLPIEKMERAKKPAEA